VNYFHTISLMPEIPHRIKGLYDLAYNLWFSWNHDAQQLFSMLDRQLWKETNHNPVKFLLNVFPGRLEKAAGNPNFLNAYDQVMSAFRGFMTKTTWFQKTHPRSNLLIAYFSAEMGVHESTPVYSGGLGVLAGDHCKSASDLGLPLVGVGILYKQGYFHQRITREGWQDAKNPYFDFYEMPVTPAVFPDGSEITISVEIGEKTVYVKVWQQQIGRIRIFLLDTDISKNSPEERRLTFQLYGGGQSTRISQEIILGMGGVRALRKMGLSPTVWHINEGHAAFLILERAKELVQNGLPFGTALEAVKSNTVFTTHTPVPAGHDVFSPEMINRYLSSVAPELGLDREKLLSLGWDEERHGFNMTKLALENSAFTNSVSSLHEQLSKKMFSDMFRRIPLEEIPLGHITNGIHPETWAAPEIKALFKKYLDPAWAEKICAPSLWEKVYSIPDGVLWEAHLRAKETLIQFTKNNLYHRMRRNLEPVEIMRESLAKLNKDTLIIGFARRFATYKRANLLLKDQNRLAKLLNNEKMPVVIIFAGKAHPADHLAQEIIKQLCDLEKDARFRGKVIFLENYDLNAAKNLVKGVDVWLNTPRRPLEASGTSGQKAALNGVLHCSILDGWWPEAYNGKNGFAVGSDKEYFDEQIQDMENLHSLYDILEQVIIPEYYHRKEDGIPHNWIARMKESLATIPKYFNTQRMVLDYFNQFYFKASQRGEKFAENSFALAAQVQQYKQFLIRHWYQINFARVKINKPQPLKAGEEIQVTGEVFLGPINPQDVVVEIFYGKVGGTGLANITLLPMDLSPTDNKQVYKFTRNMLLSPGTTKYALRIRPSCVHFASTFELPLIKWADDF